MHKKIINIVITFIMILLIILLPVLLGKPSEASVKYGIGKELDEKGNKTGWYIFYFKLDDTEKFNSLKFSIRQKNVDIKKIEYEYGFFQTDYKVSSKENIFAISSNTTVTSSDGKNISYLDENDKKVTDRVIILAKYYLEPKNSKDFNFEITNVELNLVQANSFELTVTPQKIKGKNTYDESDIFLIDKNEYFIYDVTIKNVSTINTDTIILRDIFSDYFSDYSIVGSKNYIVDENTLFLNIGKFKVGESKSLKIKARVTESSEKKLGNKICVFSVTEMYETSCEGAYVKLNND